MQYKNSDVSVTCRTPADFKEALCKIQRDIQLLVANKTCNSMGVKICFEWLSVENSGKQVHNEYTKAVENLCMTENDKFQMIKQKLIQIIPQSETNGSIPQTFAAFGSSNLRAVNLKIEKPHKTSTIQKQYSMSEVKHDIAETTQTYDLPFEDITTRKRTLDSSILEECHSYNPMNGKKTKVCHDSDTENKPPAVASDTSNNSDCMNNDTDIKSTQLKDNDLNNGSSKTDIEFRKGMPNEYYKNTVVSSIPEVLSEPLFNTEDQASEDNDLNEISFEVVIENDTEADVVKSSKTKKLTNEYVKIRKLNEESVKVEKKNDSVLEQKKVESCGIDKVKMQRGFQVLKCQTIGDYLKLQPDNKNNCGILMNGYSNQNVIGKSNFQLQKNLKTLNPSLSNMQIIHKIPNGVTKQNTEKKILLINLDKTKLNRTGLIHQNLVPLQANATSMGMHFQTKSRVLLAGHPNLQTDNGKSVDIEVPEKVTDAKIKNMKHENLEKNTETTVCKDSAEEVVNSEAGGENVDRMSGEKKESEKSIDLDSIKKENSGLSDELKVKTTKRKFTIRDEVLELIKDVELMTVDLDPCNMDDHIGGLKQYNCFECQNKKYKSKQTLVQHWKNNHLQSMVFGDVTYTAIKCSSCTMMEEICEGSSPTEKQVLQGMSLLLSHKAAAHDVEIPDYIKQMKCVIKKCEEGPFVCKASMYEHLRQSHSNQIKFKCTICLTTYNTSMYWNHVMRCAHYRNVKLDRVKSTKAALLDNLKTDFSCVFCRKHVGHDVKFDDKKSLIEHFKVQHVLNSEGKLQCFCPFCHSRIEQKPEQSEQGKVVEAGKFENEPGYKLFIQMSIHMQLKHRENVRKSFSQDIFCFFKNCTYKVKNHSPDTFTPLLRHSWKHKPKIACSKCGKVYLQTTTNHASYCSKLVEGVDTENLICDLCGKKFYCEATLNNHTSKVHEKNIRELKCDNCDYKTVHSVVLEEHIFRVHNLNPKNKPTYDCEVCDYSSLLRCNYKSHVSRQHGMKNTVCHICGKTVAGHSLKKHKETHEEKNICCPQCDFRTNLPQYLKKHMDAKHNTQRFACKSCGYTTAYSSNFASHKKKYCKNLEHNRRRAELKQQRRLEKMEKAAEKERNKRKKESANAGPVTFKSKLPKGKLPVQFVDDTESGYDINNSSTMFSTPKTLLNDNKINRVASSLNKFNEATNVDLLNDYPNVQPGGQAGVSALCDYFVDGQEIKVQSEFEDSSIIANGDEDLNLIGSDVIYVNNQSGNDEICNIEHSDLGNDNQSLLDDEFCPGSPESDFRSVVDEKLLSPDILEIDNVE